MPRNNRKPRPNYDIYSISTLPIKGYKQTIINVVRNNSVSVIYGDTGFGKTTQVPTYILEAGLNNGLQIVITQPSRIAAVSKARRVSDEMRVNCGVLVGYDVVTDNQSGEATKIKYVTEDVLLDMCLKDSSLSQCGVIMIDEAHERTMKVDVLLGIMKIIIARRNDLKVVITSANVEKDCLSAYFNNAPITRMVTTTHNVASLYEPIRDNDYVARAASIIQNSIKSTTNGDFLIFLPTAVEVDDCCDRLANLDTIVLVKLYESMNSHQHVFDKVAPPKRKVIVTTSIAETLFTLNSVRFVIDCGLIKEENIHGEYDEIECKEIKISKARANFRANKAGRSITGWCKRIYRKEEFDGFLAETVPEINRKHFGELYLKMVFLGFDPTTFDFIDKPEDDTLKRYAKTLQELGLLNHTLGLTDLGRDILDIPLKLMASKVLLAAIGLPCGGDVAIILAMLQEKYVFKKSRTNSMLMAACHESFYDADGDHFTLLHVFNEFVENGKTKEWCDNNFLNYDALIHADQLRNVLMRIMHVKNQSSTTAPLYTSNKDNIKMLFVSIYFKNICVQSHKEVYVSYLTKKNVYMDSCCSLVKDKPKLIMYNECIHDNYLSHIYGVLKIDEGILKHFPNEMEHIGYTSENIVGQRDLRCSVVNYDPFDREYRSRYDDYDLDYDDGDIFGITGYENRYDDFDLDYDDDDGYGYRNHYDDFDLDYDDNDRRDYDDYDDYDD